MTPEQAPVFVVDDQSSFRRAMASLVELSPGLRWAGEAGNGPDALAALSAIEDAVVLVDVNMPWMGGPAVVAALGGRRGLVPVLVSTYEAAELPSEVSATGVPYVSKDRLNPQLLQQLYADGR